MRTILRRKGEAVAGLIPLRPDSRVKGYLRTLRRGQRRLFHIDTVFQLLTGFFRFLLRFGVGDGKGNLRRLLGHVIAFRILRHQRVAARSKTIFHGGQVEGNFLPVRCRLSLRELGFAVPQAHRTGSRRGKARTQAVGRYARSRRGHGNDHILAVGISRFVRGGSQVSLRLANRDLQRYAADRYVVLIARVAGSITFTLDDRIRRIPRPSFGQGNRAQLRVVHA